MTAWIALLRGINVGGHRKVPMAEFKAMADELGLRNAATYVQSGNLIFNSPAESRADIEALIARGISGRFGFEADVIARNLAEWEAVIAANPFPEAALKPKTLHAVFLGTPTDSDAAERLAALPRDDEEFKIAGDTLYLLTPSGIGRSKFAAAAGRHVGVPATARNWNSVLKIADLARGLG